MISSALEYQIEDHYQQRIVIGAAKRLPPEYTHPLCQRGTWWLLTEKHCGQPGLDLPCFL